MIHGRRAFTLVEVMVAVLILALVSTAAALSFSHPLDVARLDDACRDVQQFDAATRELARSTGKPVRMTFDLSGDLVRRQGGRAADAEARFALPTAIQLTEVRVEGEAFATGAVQVDASPLGWTRSYAVRFTARSGERWLLISGVSGQATRLNDVRELDAIEATANPRSPRHDAD